MFESWHPYPLVRFLLPFVAGIFLVNAVQVSVHPGWVIGVLVGLSLWFARRMSRTEARVYTLFWLLSAGLAGAAWLDWTRPEVPWPLMARVENPGPSADWHWSGEVERVTRKAEWTRWMVNLDSAGPTGPDWPVRGRLLVYVPAGSCPPVEPGQRVRFTGSPKAVPPPSDPYGFDWQDYLRVRGIHHQVFLKAPPVVGGTASPWKVRIAGARSALSVRLEALVPDTLARQLFQAVMLGARDDLGEGLNRAYQASGSIHILAVSGLHVGLVAGLALGLFRLCFPRRFRKAGSILGTTLVVWLYIGLTGAADSALRAGVLFSFLLLGRLMARHAESLNLLAAAVLALLVADPRMAFHTGFQLSVLAVAGILTLQPVLARWFPADNRLLRYAGGLVALTLAAQIATLPLGMYTFHQFPVYFLLSGVFVVPLAGVVLTSGWLLLGLDAISPSMGRMAAGIAEWPARVMNLLVQAIADLPGALSTGWDLAWWWVVLLPVIGSAAILAWQGRNLRLVRFILVLGILGSALDLARSLDRKGQDLFGLVRRQGLRSEILVRHQGRSLLLDLGDEAGETRPVDLPGYGRTWLVPATVPFRFGEVGWSGSILGLRKDSLSWGGVRLRKLHVARGFPSGRDLFLGNGVVLLPRELGYRERSAWQRRLDGHGIDLRETGSWIHPVE